MVTREELNEFRSKMYIGMKLLMKRKDSYFEKDIVKKQVTVCDMSKNNFTVKWLGAMGDELRECFKYVDLIIGDKGIEVV